MFKQIDIKGLTAWSASLITLGYVLIKAFLAIGIFEVVSIFLSNISLQIEFSEFLTGSIILSLILILLRKDKAFQEKETFVFPKIKITFLLIVSALGLRLFEDPFFRYENILFSEPLIRPNEEELLTINLSVFFKILNIALITPVLEEFFFRKIILRSLIKRHSNVFMAVILSSALFSITHWSIRNSIPTFIFGIVSSFIYLRTKNISYSILFHIISNIIWLILSIDPTNYYWAVLNDLNFGIYYWLLVISGCSLALLSLNKILKIKSNN